MKAHLLTLALLGGGLTWGASALAAPAPPLLPATRVQGGDKVTAIKAGTIHLVEGGQILENGTILVRGNRIQQVGTDIVVPPSAEVIDYGPGAVIIPGLVAAYSTYGSGSPSDRTAEPGLRGVDGFDFYSRYASALTGGVTSVYVTPADNRLIAGTGGLVKLAGENAGRRTVNASAAIHGAIDGSARTVQGYWEPPIPATVDQGMGFQRPQLPRTTMGAILGLEELLQVASSGATDTLYGPYAGAHLKSLMDAGTPWRIGATNEREIRALLDFAKTAGVPLVIDKATGAKDLATEIAASGAAVIFRVPYSANTSSGRELGKSRDANWPQYDVPAALVEAGVRVAITGNTPRDLLFHAGLASRGGLDPAAALRAITLTPAELCGAADRVGSIRAGKDADLVVLGGPPISGGMNVMATWIDGDVAWLRSASGPAGASSSRGGRSGHGGAMSAVVLDVAELHVGDGEVLRPGQLLIRNGKIVEVGSQVARPAGAVVYTGQAAMPGIIDALGHLGLENSRRVPSTDFELTQIVGPGDHVDRRVAAAGITTVVLSPRGASTTGAPMMAYKPAAEELAHQVIGDPVALRVSWESRNRQRSGDAVRGLLAKAKSYVDDWAKYEKEMAKWTPPPPAPEKEEDEAADEEKKDEEGDDDKKGDDKKKKKKKKKGEKEELEPDPITGRWLAEIGDPAVPLKLRLLFDAGKGSGDVEGNLRSTLAGDELVELEGYWNRDENSLTVAGLGADGWVRVEGKIEEMKLVGKLNVAGAEHEFSAERTSKDYPVARRSERRPEKSEASKRVKGQPKEPKLDRKLEPFRAAMEGRGAIICEVQREDEILDCVATFEKFGIKPILYGATDAYKVADRISGRVAGVLLSQTVLLSEAKRGTAYRTPYVDLQTAGIPVAFHSGREEGAVDLPLAAAYAVANGMSPSGALRALTSDTARMMAISHRVGRLAPGMDGDVLLLDGPPVAAATSVLRAFVNGVEVH